MSIRIVVVDDDCFVCHGIRGGLKSFARIDVVGDAGDGETGLALIEKARPDVVVLDIAMPKMSGRQVAERLHKLEGVKIVVLTGYSNPYCIECMRDVGVTAFVQKGESPSVLHQAIMAAAEGREFVSEMTQRVLDDVRASMDQPICRVWSEMSPRQQEVARLVADGLQTKEIASQLGISPETVSKHRAALRERIRAQRGVDVVRIGTEYRMTVLQPYHGRWPCEECHWKMYDTGRRSHTPLCGAGGMRETGDRRQETGDRRQETGDRRQETGDRRQETGDRRP